ncbi:hypothetical protein MPER_06779 [Moniliophthora perniciosa FA553]|nr:hypothetical protein MPER_06779 [Moniliophthora perniciosa FA553]
MRKITYLNLSMKMRMRRKQRGGAGNVEEGKNVEEDRGRPWKPAITTMTRLSGQARGYFFLPFDHHDRHYGFVTNKVEDDASNAVQATAEHITLVEPNSSSMFVSMSWPYTEVSQLKSQLKADGSK